MIFVIICNKNISQYEILLTPSNVVTEKYPLISNAKDTYVVQRTRKIVSDYLTIDHDVLRETKMCAFFIGKVKDEDGSKRAETVMQLLQKLRDDITDQRASLMKEITQICSGNVLICKVVIFSQCAYSHQSPLVLLCTKRMTSIGRCFEMS